MSPSEAERLLVLALTRVRLRTTAGAVVRSLVLFVRQLSLSRVRFSIPCNSDHSSRHDHDHRTRTRANANSDGIRIRMHMHVTQDQDHLHDVDVDVDPRAAYLIYPRPLAIIEINHVRMHCYLYYI